MMWTRFLAIYFLLGVSSPAYSKTEPTPRPTPRPSAPPAVDTLVKPAAFKHMSQDHEVIENAELASATSDGNRHYSFYLAMQVDASVRHAREILLDYRIYKKSIPFVDDASFDERKKILDIAGGIFGFKLHSQVAFEEVSDEWVRYRVIGGHFVGLKGDIFFEPQARGGTQVYFAGALDGRRWPPAFVMEQGAGMVFTYTARKMRSFIEQPAGEPTHGPNEGTESDPALPQPRRHL